MSEYTDAVESGIKGMRGVSTGCCPGCESCMDIDGYTDPGEHRLAWESGDTSESDSFSSRPCGICGSTLGGNRERWHWISGGDEHGKGGTIEHEDDACTDCVVYLANGDEPEVWEEGTRRAAKRHKSALDRAFRCTMTRAYLECVLFAETDNADDSGGEPLDRNYSIGDFTTDALESAYADCQAFRAMRLDVSADALANVMVAADAAQEGRLGDAAALLDSNPTMGELIDEHGTDERAGRDLWFTRMGHGAGFWDGDWPDKVGEALTACAERMGGEHSLNPSITEEGEVCFG